MRQKGRAKFSPRVTHFTKYILEPFYDRRESTKSLEKRLQLEGSSLQKHKKTIMFRPARAIDNLSSIIRGGNLQNLVSVVLTKNLFIETHN